MNSFTVEIVMAPVKDGAWRELRNVTDVLPGTLLIEDPDEPMLIVPVDADSQKSAALFVQGAMSVMGLEIKWGRAYLAEPLDVDMPDGMDDPHPKPSLAPAWLEDEATTEIVRESVPA